jgi:DNA-binding transcriptional LysR family regulator
MDTDLIRQFCGITEAGTIAQAARVLHMTPGALSRAMKRLETELETALFLPSGRNIVPTPEAKHFYERGRMILKSIQEAKTSLKDLKNFEKPIRIASFEIFSTHFISRFFEQENLTQEVATFERVPHEIEESVLANQVDFGITYIPTLHPDLDHLAIGDMHLGVYTRGSEIKKDLPFAVPITSMGENILSVTSLDGWPADVARNIKFRVQQLETALDLASRGVAKVCCPQFLVKIENERLGTNYQLKAVTTPPGVHLPKLKVYLVKRKSDVETAVFKKISKNLRLVLK